jgi:phenylacetate-coenzyme A ligase PaaK-like adenylate-forming protein
LIKKTIYQLGSRWRNPSLIKSFQFLKTSEKFSLDELQDYQLKEIKKFLIFVDEYSVYFRNIFGEHNFDPKTLNSLDDIKKIKTSSKEDLIVHNESIHSHYPFKKKFFCETSGSSGQVLTFNRNEKWDSMNRAAIWRGYSWYGVNPWDKNIYFWGYDMSPSKKLKVRVLDYFQNRFRLFDYSERSIEKMATELDGFKYIHGYSSMIYEMAKMINQNDIKIENSEIKLIKGTSEKIYSHYESEITRAFGRKMISEYGAAEAGIIAFECPFGNMHLNMEGCYVEEENNEILVTNFLSYSFPIIRYKLGDYIKLSEESSCECGIAHPILEEVKGRVGKNIYGVRGKYASLTLYYVFKNMFFDHGISLNYQCIQREKGQLHVNITNELSGHEREILMNEFDKYFSYDIEITIKDNAVIHLHKGKLVDFISKIEF